MRTRPSRFLASLLLACASLLSCVQAGERLPNGLVLPDDWPPRPEAFARDKPVTPPYLASPPAVLPIDLGRQLFVDDFLIDKSTLRRTFHQPTWHPATPVLKAETPWEVRSDRPFAAPFSDGVWYDPKDRVFKMWYMGGTAVFFCYATSADGVRWTRPELKQFPPEGSNILKVEPIQRDSATVWLDLEEKDPARRYKLVYFRSKQFTRFSPDGLRWSDPVAVQPTGDRSTFFYNPFRKVWVYSVRASRRGVGRCRYYAETTDLAKTSWESLDELSRWACADSLDRVRPLEYEDERPDLYNLDATPYESLMLGLFAIHSRIAHGDRPKINHVTLGYSRDGFHWHRPDRRPFLDVSDDREAWNYGNVQSAGGGCLVMGDQLYFYCSGRNSRKEKDDGSGASTGLAVLRRDGFASLDAGAEAGSVTTRPVVFKGKHLFVNAACAEGELRAEVLGEDGKVLPGFSAEQCNLLSTDATLARVTWRGVEDLGELAGRPVRFRFTLRQGRLYAFWVSPDESGASHGYLAAGGPGYRGHRDTVGSEALREFEKTFKK